MADDETWFDDAAGPLVRPYTMTGGRTRTSRIELDLVTLVVAVPNDPNRPVPEPEYRGILAVCQQPTSIAEVSAQLDLPLGVVKVLIGDLIERRQMIYRSAMTPAPDVLQAVLDGIRNL